MFATKAQMISRYGEAMLISLTDRAKPPVGVIDDAVLDLALANADAEIEGFLLGRYALPLAAVPAQINEIAQVITIWKLHRNQASEKIQADYDQAQKRLRDIASGVFRLNLAGVEPAASSGGSIMTNGTTAVLTGGTMEGFI